MQEKLWSSLLAPTCLLCVAFVSSVDGDSGMCGEGKPVGTDTVVTGCDGCVSPLPSLSSLSTRLLSAQAVTTCLVSPTNMPRTVPKQDSDIYR